MKIAIWGMGVSGMGALRYLAKKTDHEIYLINSGELASWPHKDEILSLVDASQCYPQDQCSELADKLDLIVMSPGIDPKMPALVPFKGVKKICEVELAYQQVDIPIVAVTGTNGKTTTVTLLTEALELAGKNVFLAGNIGTPFCEILLQEKEFDIAVLELSSFQLELMDKFHPQVGVILNLEPTHMERYASFAEYENAKLLILKNMGADDLFIAPGKYLGRKEGVPKFGIKPIAGIDFSKSKLVGEHHLLNFDVVDKVLSYFKLDQGRTIIQKLVNEFSGVPYRLQYIGSKDGVDFYNDAKSTNTAATVSALKSFSDKRVALIMGGKLRDDTQDLAAGLKDFGNIEVLYAFGEAKDFIAQQLAGLFNVVVKENLGQVMAQLALQDVQVVLFSPGFPSFDQYDNYVARGQAFTSLLDESL